MLEHGRCSSSVQSVVRTTPSASRLDIMYLHLSLYCIARTLVGELITPNTEIPHRHDTTYCEILSLCVCVRMQTVSDSITGKWLALCTYVVEQGRVFACVG